MRAAAISEIKAKLAQFLRLVKSGEEVEILDRGVPVARLTSPKKASAAFVTMPRKNPHQLATLKFGGKLKTSFDVVKILTEDRSKR